MPYFQLRRSNFPPIKSTPYFNLLSSIIRYKLLLKKSLLENNELDGILVDLAETLSGGIKLKNEKGKIYFIKKDIYE